LRIAFLLNGQEVIFDNRIFKRKGPIATWTGKDGTGQATILLTLASNHFWGHITSDRHTMVLLLQSEEYICSIRSHLLEI
jgi:hypothetical protein